MRNRLLSKANSISKADLKQACTKNLQCFFHINFPKTSDIIAASLMKVIYFFVFFQVPYPSCFPHPAKNRNHARQRLFGHLRGFFKAIRIHIDRNDGGLPLDGLQGVPLWQLFLKVPKNPTPSVEKLNISLGFGKKKSQLDWLIQKYGAVLYCMYYDESS